MIPYRKDLKIAARELRSAMTPAEEALWSRLRRRQVLDLQFYRQKPILDFVVDFYAPKAGLVIEVDGDHHAEEDQAIRDQRRDEILAGIDLAVLRFANHEVMTAIEQVVETIRATALERLESMGRVGASPL